MTFIREKPLTYARRRKKSGRSFSFERQQATRQMRKPTAIGLGDLSLTEPCLIFSRLFLLLRDGPKPILGSDASIVRSKGSAAGVGGRLNGGHRNGGTTLQPTPNFLRVQASTPALSFFGACRDYRSTIPPSEPLKTHNMYKYTRGVFIQSEWS